MSGVALFRVSGRSGSGKTTLIERLLAEFARRGVKTATAKHHRETIDTDIPGKDTWRHRKAGAAATFFSMPGQIALHMAVEGDPGPDALVPHCPPGTRVLLAEGFKEKAGPPVIWVEGEAGHPAPEGALCIVAVAPRPDSTPPVFGRDEIEDLADFLLARLPEDSP